MPEKQPQLNGAYYGPAIPPPNNSYHRPGRGVGCDCRFSLILNLILLSIFIVGTAVLLVWLIVLPYDVDVNLTALNLTQFNYTNNTLCYNLALNITVRNPNNYLGIYYDYFEAQALYKDARFDLETLEPFYQGHLATNELYLVLQGQQVIALDAEQTSELNKEKSSGVYDIEVKLYLRVRFKLGVLKFGKLKPKIDYEFHVPLSSVNEISPADGGFDTTKCDWH